jgi:hypothetical protein
VFILILIVAIGMALQFLLSAGFLHAALAEWNTIEAEFLFSSPFSAFFSFALDVQSFEHFSFNCTIIFEYGNLRLPSRSRLPHCASAQNRGFSFPPASCSFINMFYCSFECEFSVYVGARGGEGDV